MARWPAPLPSPQNEFLAGTGAAGTFSDVASKALFANSLIELADKVGVTVVNLSVLKSGRAR